jgi:hypothetical protein
MSEHQSTRRLDSPNCSTCRHFLPENPSYPACAVVNLREGWGDLAYMPTEPEDVCHRHEDKKMADV